MWLSFLKTVALFFSLFYQEKILVVGDSEAAHVSHFYEYVRTYREDISSEFKGGTNIQQWQDGLMDAALAKHPDVDTVVIFLGTNNIGRKTELDVSAILGKIKGKKCIWVGPPAVRGKKWLFNKLLRDNVLKVSKCFYLNSEEIKLTLPDEWHPAPQSSILWLREVWSLKNEMD